MIKKFSELEIGDRFRQYWMGASNDAYFKDSLDFARGEDSFEIVSMDRNDKVELLPKTLSGPDREVLKTFLREELKISIDKYRRYGDSGLRVKLILCDEEISESEVTTEYHDS